MLPGYMNIPRTFGFVQDRVPGRDKTKTIYRYSCYYKLFRQFKVDCPVTGNNHMFNVSS